MAEIYKGLSDSPDELDPVALIGDKRDEIDLSVITSFIDEVKRIMAEQEIDVFKKSKVQQIIGQCEMDFKYTDQPWRYDG